MENVTISMPEKPAGANAGTIGTIPVGELTPAVARQPVLKEVPISLIVGVRNPRHSRHASRPIRFVSTSDSALPSGDGGLAGSDPDPDPDPGLDLEGLARSLGSEGDPRLAEPPVVEEMPDGRYRLCAGERRVEAARLATWTRVLCLVYPPMDPVRAHTLGLVENLHRLPMHPLEEISALCISRLLANADARGVGAEAGHLLEDAWERQETSYNIIRGLEQILRDCGWSPERPNVTWKAHLDDLGISMAPWERKRKLRLLNIEPALQERLRELDITEAALRALGTLEPGDQTKVVDALISNPSLARKVRRVARARRDGFYTTIEDALAEVQGLQGWPSLTSTPVTTSVGPVALTMDTGSGTHPAQALHEQSWHPSEIEASTSEGIAGQVGQVSPDIQDAVLQLLECADRLSAALKSLEAYNGGVALPEPWGTWSRDALDFIISRLPVREAIEAHPG